MNVCLKKMRKYWLIHTYKSTQQLTVSRAYCASIEKEKQESDVFFGEKHIENSVC